MPTSRKRLRIISDERRLVRLQIPDEVLIGMMYQGFEFKAKTIEGIPPGAMFITAVNDPALGVTWFFFEHESFNIVPMGSEIPIIPWRIEYAH